MPTSSDGELYLVNIQDVDDEKGMMKSSGWVGFSWMDEYARWNPAEFGGIKVGGKKHSNRNLDIPALFGNYDRPTDQPIKPIVRPTYLLTNRS